MMGKIRGSWFFLGLVFLLPAIGNATIEKKHWELGITPGISIPATNSNDVQNESNALALSLEYQWSRKLSAGLEFSKDFGHQLDGTLFTDIDNDGIVEALKAQSDEKAVIYRIGPILKFGSANDWGTWGTRWVRSFLVFGAGLYHFQLNEGQYNVYGPSSGGTTYNGEAYPIAAESSDHFGLSVGCGMSVEVFTHGLVGLEIRYHRYFQNAPDAEYWVPSLKFGLAY